jgi:hypothetical protein
MRCEKSKLRIAKTLHMYCNGDPFVQATKHVAFTVTGPILQINMIITCTLTGNKLFRSLGQLRFLLDGEPLGLVTKFPVPTGRKFKFCRPLRCNTATGACLHLGFMVLDPRTVS